jgi:hypothetical protein
MHRGRGRGIRSEELSHGFFKCKKHEKGNPLGFLTTPSTQLKKILPNPQGPPQPTTHGFLTTVHLMIGEKDKHMDI